MTAPPTGRAHPRHAAPPRWDTRRALVAALTGAVALLGIVAVITMTLTQRLGDNVARVPNAFAGLDRSTRPPSTAGGVTFLLIGTDSHADVSATDPVAGAAGPDGSGDVLMIARLADDGRTAAVVAIPHDSWVPVPGHGLNTINAAYTLGGPSLLVQTVEDLTTLHIDHFAVLDFAGFRPVVDSVGGIDLAADGPADTDGVRPRPRVSHLDGAQAVAYVRQRRGLADDDFDRARRQQNALHAVVGKAASTGALDDPVGTYRLLDAAGRFVSLDDTFTTEGLRGLVHRLGGLPADGVSFLRAPVAGLGWEGAQSVVHLDPSGSTELWNALRGGNVGAYLDQHDADALGPVTR